MRFFRNTPSPYFWRALHSLTGLGLVIFLIQHLWINSQAALFFGDDGRSFIHSVNAIQDLAYLPLVELALIALPLLIHGIWGMPYAIRAKLNSFGRSDLEPYLPQYSRNRAFTWQRITAYLLIGGILAHVIHMRFVEYPQSGQKENKHYYTTRVSYDSGIDTVASRLGVDLIKKPEVEQLTMPKENEAYPSPVEKQRLKQNQKYIRTLKSYSLTDSQLIAVANNFATAELFMLRDAFKHPLTLFLYTLLVLASCFHAFNGLWTGLIRWGILVTAKSQALMLKLCWVLIFTVSFLGLVAIWGTYWINLRH